MVGPAVAGPEDVAALDRRCRHGEAEQPFFPSLPAARRALRETGKLVIVALGSSTTAGSGASDATRSYPAVLEAELRRRLPFRDITVVNKGIGGQTAYDMLMRIDSDVLDEKPSVVIWQTGVNDAIRDEGEERLSKILHKGIRKMRKAGVDVLMMGMQWLPRADRYPKYESYRTVLAQAAGAADVPVFPRFEMMKAWAVSNQFTPDELVGVDGLHMVDSSYHCLAVRVADGIVGELGQAKAMR